LDGVNELESLRGNDPARDELFLGYSTENDVGKGKQGKIGAMAAIRVDNWKLLRKRNGRSYLLYDLDTDPGETNDLSSSRGTTRIVKRLKKRLLEYELNVRYLPLHCFPC
jgi:hypothetical protein